MKTIEAAMVVFFAAGVPDAIAQIPDPRGAEGAGSDAVRCEAPAENAAGARDVRQPNA